MEDFSNSVVLITFIGIIAGASGTITSKLFDFLDRRHERYLRHLEIEEKKRKEEKEFLISITRQIITNISELKKGIGAAGIAVSHAELLGLINLVRDQEIDEIFEKQGFAELDMTSQIHLVFYKVVEHLGHRIRDL